MAIDVIATLVGPVHLVTTLTRDGKVTPWWIAVQGHNSERKPIPLFNQDGSSLEFQ
jgi:hypothetical protein